MILLSFDTEEFDLPKELGQDYDPVKQGMVVSRCGINKILDILEENHVRATFFCTTNFADNAPEEMKRIVEGGHEVAAHGCNHFCPKPEDSALCKKRLEELTGKTVYGWRQPRMFKVDTNRLREEGFRYNASLNPAFIPGRYMHLTMPRTVFEENGIKQIPASVSPWLRIPMFWLSLHHFPQCMYHWLCRRIVKHDGYFNTYFHPWEFYPLGEHKELGVPYIIKHNAGEGMQKSLSKFIQAMKSHNYEFTTYSEFLQE